MNIIGDVIIRVISDSKMLKNFLIIFIFVGILNGFVVMIVLFLIDIIVGLMSIICLNEVDMKIFLFLFSSRL